MLLMSLRYLFKIKLKLNNNNLLINIYRYIKLISIKKRKIHKI